MRLQIIFFQKDKNLKVIGGRRILTQPRLLHKYVDLLCSLYIIISNL